MREPTAHRIEQLIKQHMPPGAVGYFFQQITADNRVLRFPETGCFKLIAPFQLPVGVPGGTYQVFFLRSLEDAHPLPPKDPEYPYPEVAFYFAPSPATHAAPPEESSPPRRWAAASEVEQSPALREARVDFRKRRMAMRLQHSLDMIAEHRKRLAELANPPPPPPPHWVTLVQQFMPALVQLGATAFASTKFAAGAPPELIKTLATSLAAMTPGAVPSLMPATTAPAVLPGQTQPVASLPLVSSQPAAPPQPAQPPAVSQRQPELPPLANGTLTVQDLYYVLAAFQQADTPESKQVLAQWTALADQLNPERAGRRQAPAAPVAAPQPPEKAQ